MAYANHIIVNHTHPYTVIIILTPNRICDNVCVNEGGIGGLVKDFRWTQVLCHVWFSLIIISVILWQFVFQLNIRHWPLKIVIESFKEMSSDLSCRLFLYDVSYMLICVKRFIPLYSTQCMLILFWFQTSVHTTFFTHNNIIIYNICIAPYNTIL